MNQSSNPIYRRIEADFAAPWFDDRSLEQALGACAQSDGVVCVVSVNQHQIRQAVVSTSDAGMIEVAAALAYPLGNLPLQVKRIQARAALEAGASRLDLVIPIEHLKSGREELFREELLAILEITNAHQAALLLCVDWSVLSEREKSTCASVAADFDLGMKIGSGFGQPGRVEDLLALRQKHVFANTLVPCGAYTLFQEVDALLGAGATRVCTREPFKTMQGYRTLVRHGYGGG